MTIPTRVTFVWFISSKLDFTDDPCIGIYEEFGESSISRSYETRNPLRSDRLNLDEESQFVDRVWSGIAELPHLTALNIDAFPGFTQTHVQCLSLTIKSLTLRAHRELENILDIIIALPRTLEKFALRGKTGNLATKEAMSCCLPNLPPSLTELTVDRLFRDETDCNHSMLLPRTLTNIGTIRLKTGFMPYLPPALLRLYIVKGSSGFDGDVVFPSSIQSMQCERATKSFFSCLARSVLPSLTCLTLHEPDFIPIDSIPSNISSLYMINAEYTNSREEGAFLAKLRGLKSLLLCSGDDACFPPPQVTQWLPHLPS